MYAFPHNIGIYFEHHQFFFKDVSLYAYRYLILLTLSNWIKDFSEINTIRFFSSQQSYRDPMNDEVKMILHNFL